MFAQPSDHFWRIAVLVQGIARARRAHAENLAGIVGQEGFARCVESQEVLLMAVLCPDCAKRRVPSIGPPLRVRIENDTKELHGGVSRVLPVGVKGAAPDWSCSMW
jgi:hypothetical protein